MAITEVQTSPGVGGGSSPSAADTFGSNVTSGNVIFVGIRLGGTVSGVADNLGNTYTQRQTTTDPGGDSLYIYTAPVTTGGSCTVTVSAGSGTIRFGCEEVSGVSAYDTGAVGSGTSTSLATASCTPAAGAYLFSTAAVAADHTFTHGTGYASLFQTTKIMNQSKVHTSGSTTADATIDSQPDNNWGICVASFTASGGGGGRTLFYSPSLDGLSSAGPKQFNPTL